MSLSESVRPGTPRAAASGHDGRHGIVAGVPTHGLELGLERKATVLKVKTQV